MNKTPKLRFKEFSGDWESKKLDEITTYVDYRGKTPPKSENGIFLVTAKNIKNGYIDYSASQEFISEHSYDEAMRRGLPKKGDVLLTTEAPLGNVAQIDREDIALAQRVIKFRGTEELNNTYLKYYFLSEKFQNKLFTKAIGTTVLGIQGKVLHKMPINFPKIEEQDKIAFFVSLIDDKIYLQGEKVEALKDYKSGMMQKIFSRELRFNDDGRDYPEWKEKKLKSMLKEVSEKTKENNQHEVISSTTNGLFLQKEYFNREIASSDNTGYKIIRRNQVVLSPQNLWMGNINFNEKYDIGIVSPSYKIFDINDKFDSKYIGYILRTPRAFYEFMQSSEQGASIVRRNLNMDLFNEISFDMPCKEEQVKIAKFIGSIDLKIEKEQDKLDSLNEYKKGLLQQMFV